MAQTLTQPAHSPAEGHSEDRRKWLVLIAMVFGLFMPQLDNLVLNVALPTIQRDFGAGVSGLQWIIDSYTLTFASFMLTAGALGDLYGRKRLFMGGLVLFSLGSLACGLSSTTSQLIAFRAAQGVGAAALLPGSLSIISATFHGRERGSAIGIWAAMSGVAAAIGPVAGGYLVEHFSWNSIFFINIPTGIVGLTLTYFVVRESKDATRSRRLDPPGLITGTAGLFCLVFALIEGNARGWTNPVIIGMFLLAAVLLTVFVIVESRRPSPMFPLSFFRIPTFAAANAVAAAVFFAMFGSIFFLTLYMQNILQYSPVQAGTRLLAFSGVILFAAPISGRLSDRFGSRWLMACGTLVAACGMALLLRTQTNSTYLGVLLPAFMVLAAGMGMTMTPMTAAVMGSVEIRHAGIASAATNTSRELGGVFGIALLGAIVTTAFTRGLSAQLVAAGVPLSQAQALVARLGTRAAAGNVGQGSSPVIAHAVRASFVHALHVGLGIGVASMLLASLLSVCFIRSHIRRRETP